MNDAEDAGIAYAAAVERFVTLLSGRGLFLSAKDRALAEQWFARGIDLETSCRALAEAFASYREDQGVRAKWPRSLRFFEEAVVKAALRVQPFGASEPARTVPAQPVRPSLAEQIGWLADAQTEARLHAAWQCIALMANDVDESVDRDEALAELDDALVSDFLGRLTSEETEALDAAIEAALRPERGRLGTRGLEGRRRAILRDELETRFGLSRLETPGGGVRGETA